MMKDEWADKVLQAPILNPMIHIHILALWLRVANNIVSYISPKLLSFS